ncbi:hypothetical protein [Rhizobium leguminosarum]|uniref:hypothetical protein n=1 Tax=Rhizobium leguminosarum TaxID=384 RepID=UPI00103A35A5|nr:hypothetical protein [Rhizobium leguminosarum]NKK29592.1 hypothetical protein [Rhizobium leguminosarum bv. viciae]TBZ54227.1 hypothetical protein E0H42_14395 [Rhizobium leguminosarum bv. viciae]
MEEDDFQVILYNEPEQESKDRMLDRIVGTLCIAGLEVHGYFGSNAEQPMRIYFARLQELRVKAQGKRSFSHSIS